MQVKLNKFMLTDSELTISDILGNFQTFLREFLEFPKHSKNNLEIGIFGSWEKAEFVIYKHVVVRHLH